jgi:amidophosphoribosyltransferase
VGRYNEKGLEIRQRTITLGAWEIEALKQRSPLQDIMQAFESMFDKFHDECGVVAIYGHPEASKLAYLGLYALQHRGQESAGICTSDGREIHCRKVMGHVADIFTSPVLASCPAKLAIGHTRYSTAGDTVLLNAQPFSVACNKGRSRWRTTATSPTPPNCAPNWKRRGSIFQAIQRHRSDSAPGGALFRAHAGGRPARRAAAAGRRVFAGVSGAGPHHRGARSARLPAAGRGQMDFSGGRKCYVFASETCAFDLIGAVYLHDVKPGEMIIVGPEGHHARTLRAGAAALAVRFRARLFLAPDSIVFGRPVQESREMLGACWRANVPPMPTWWCRCRIPAWRRPSAIPPNPGCRSARR